MSQRTAELVGSNGGWRAGSKPHCSCMSHEEGGPGLDGHGLKNVRMSGSVSATAAAGGGRAAVAGSGACDSGGIAAAAETALRAAASFARRFSARVGPEPGRFFGPEGAGPSPAAHAALLPTLSHH